MSDNAVLMSNDEKAVKRFVEEHERQGEECKVKEQGKVLSAVCERK